MAHATAPNPAKTARKIANAPYLPAAMPFVRQMKHARIAAWTAVHALAIPAMTACAPERKHVHPALRIAGNAAAGMCAATAPAAQRKIAEVAPWIADRAGEMPAGMISAPARKPVIRAPPIAANARMVPCPPTAAILFVKTRRPVIPALQTAEHVWLPSAAMQSATVRNPVPRAHKIAGSATLWSDAATVSAHRAKHVIPAPGIAEAVIGRMCAGIPVARASNPVPPVPETAVSVSMRNPAAMLSAGGSKPAQTAQGIAAPAAIS